MISKFQVYRRTLLAALALVVAFSAAFAVMPVQAATTKTTSETWNFTFIYHWDARAPSPADAVPVNVRVLRGGKSQGGFINLKYGERFKMSLPFGLYTVEVFRHSNGQLFKTIKLPDTTNHEQNSLRINVWLPNTSPPPNEMIVIP